MRNRAFASYFEGRKRSAGVPARIAASILMPEYISFKTQVGRPRQESRLPPELQSELTEEMREYQKYLDYFRVFNGGIPSDGSEYTSEALNAKILGAMPMIEARVHERDEPALIIAADSGDGDAALDYAIRYIFLTVPSSSPN